MQSTVRGLGRQGSVASWRGLGAAKPHLGLTASLPEPTEGHLPQLLLLPEPKGLLPSLSFYIFAFCYK